jgi:molybdate transport system substrate-binding protein
MLTRRRFVAVLTIAMIPACATGAGEIRVAAAADLQFVMPDLIAQFEKQTGTKVNVSYGSSGNFFSQIENGAPFDLFFSADLQYPQQLESAGLTEPGTLYKYALGHLVIWMAPSAKIDVAREGWKVLLDATVQKIAIANPAHAPYGRAAVSALKNQGIYDQVSAKLVYGENISQTAQFVQSGNAQAGIIALSLALSPAMKDGKRWQIPATAHPPIEQAVVILKSASNKDAAQAFLAFVKSDSARAILSKYGFEAPTATPAHSAPPNN